MTTMVCRYCGGNLAHTGRGYIHAFTNEFHCSVHKFKLKHFNGAEDASGYSPVGTFKIDMDYKLQLIDEDNRVAEPRTEIDDFNDLIDEYYQTTE